MEATDDVCEALSRQIVQIPQHLPDLAHMALWLNEGAPSSETLLKPVLPTLSGGSGASFARAGVALVATTYGSNYACVKLLDGWIGSAAEAAVLRFSISAFIAVPTLLCFGWKRSPLSCWPVARDGLAIGTLFGLGYIVQAVALETSAASLQAFLLSLSVIVCPILNLLVAGESQSVRVWVAACIALIGVICLEGAQLASAAPAIGDAIGLLQPVFFGSGYWLCERAITRHRKTSPGIALPVALTAWNLVAVLLVALLWFAAAAGSDPLNEPEPRPGLTALAIAITGSPMDHLPVLAALLWTGIVTTAGCSFAEAAALAEISSAEATVIFATEPLWGALFARQMVGELFKPSIVVGGFLIAAACVVSAGDAACLPTLPAWEGLRAGVVWRSTAAWGHKLSRSRAKRTV